MIVSPRTALEIITNPSIKKMVPSLSPIFEKAKDIMRVAMMKNGKSSGCSDCDQYALPEVVGISGEAWEVLVALGEREIDIIKKIYRTGKLDFIRIRGENRAEQVHR